MRLKMPFLTLRKHIDVFCYTNFHLVQKTAPITTTGRVGAKTIETVKSDHASFRTCYGFIKTFKHSFTVPAWCEFNVEATPEQCSYHFPNPQVNRVEFHQEDLSWRPDDIYISKMLAPWAVETKENIDFVIASHALNTTGMHIPTGITNFLQAHHMHIFNYVPKSCSYHVPFKTPLVSVFPLSDRPLAVHSCFDSEKHGRMTFVDDNKAFFKASALKLDKILRSS